MSNGQETTDGLIASCGSVEELLEVRSLGLCACTPTTLVRKFS
jgi:hypothetical protein